MDKTMLNKRQDAILEYLDFHKMAGIGDLTNEIEKRFTAVSKVTVNRDLAKLLQLNLIRAGGAGRAVKYGLSEAYSIVKPVDVEKYFGKEIDDRDIRERFNFDIFSNLKNVITDKEKRFFEDLNELYRKKIRELPKDVLKKEFERLTIELSWKSSRIEGNTYTLLETEQLLLEHKEAKGHSSKEAVMILNHKKALDYMKGNLSSFKKMSVKPVEEVHSILVDGLDVSKNIRNTLVGITGTRFKPLDNQFQITEALKRTCILVNKTENLFEKALIMMVMIAYIQPFVDGNKRTSRLIGNAILLEHNACPLSYRSIDEIEYKKAVLLFYEQNNLSYFKKLFLDQFEFAVQNYFL